MPSVFLEFAVFSHVPFFQCGSHWPRIVEQVLSLQLYEDLFPGGIGRGITTKVARKRLWGRGRDMATFRLVLLLLHIFHIILLLSFCFLLLIGGFTFLALQVFVCRGM